MTAGSRAPDASPAAVSRRALAGISPDAYRHPLDRQATAALRRVPGFAPAAATLSRYGIEQLLYVEACANAVKVTPRQCGRIHGLLRDACGVLDLSLVPDLFLAQTPIANAFAMGQQKPCIVLQTGLVELLDEDELRAVLAHELGHIHCGHSVYRLMALVVTLVLSRLPGPLLGLGDLFSLGLQAALLEWSRKAEFSADRAALLCVQDGGEALFRALFKLTGGTPKVFAEMDRDEYLRQAEEYDAPGSPALDKLYKLVLTVPQAHPIPVLRAREALRWGRSDDYRAILEGRYVRQNETLRESAAATAPGASTGAAPAVCARCSTAAPGAFSFCIECGADLSPAAGAEDAMPAGRETAMDEKDPGHG